MFMLKADKQVSAGDKIADVTLDTAGQQRQAQAYSSLLSAQNNLQNANAQIIYFAKCRYLLPTKSL